MYGMKEIAKYRHYIYCWDCKTMNDPTRLTMSKDRFDDIMLYNIKKSYPVWDLKKEDLINQHPEDYFNSNGIACKKCGSSNIELKVLNDEHTTE